MRAPLVFVTQMPARFQPGKGWTPKFDITPAAEFGDLVYLCGPGNLFRDQFDSQVEQIRATLRKHEFTSADYIFPLGDPVVIAAVCAIASEIAGGRFTLLKWQRISGRAEAFQVNVGARA